MVDAIDPQPDETFLEIGPGRGALTRPLAARAAHVVAFEIDRDLAAALRASSCRERDGRRGRLPRPSTLDALALPPSGPRVAGNLPYNVASPILFKLVEIVTRPTPARATRR